jgi:Multidrug resistance efflux pump
MEMQPITLTRLIDKLCDNGWIERRGDETDRRVNRLYLKKAARRCSASSPGLRSELTATALEGINPADAHRLLAQLDDQGKRSQRDPESARRTSQKGTARWLIPSSNSRPNRRQSGAPTARPKLAAEPRRRLMAGMRRYRRFLLLVVLPLVAAIAGFTFYLNGGRYVTTDDAYVGAQKVLITSDVSGKIIK